jgi:hypothetical protein
MAFLVKAGGCLGSEDGVLGEGGRLSWGRARDLGVVFSPVNGYGLFLV